MLVLPFANMSALEGQDLNTRCPVCGRIFVAGTVEPEASGVLTTALTDWLRTQTDYDLVVADQAQQQSVGYLPQGGPVTVDRQTLVQAGRNSGTDAVLAGYVYRYRERIGRKYSASSPASVAFGMHLIRVADGVSVWQGHYEETQGRLLDNMYQLGTFLQRRGQWVSAEAMARYGLNQILANFPRS